MAAQMASVSTQDHLVDHCWRTAEGLLADLLHRHAVGEQADVIELARGGRPSSERAMASESTGSHADHLDLRPQRLT
jgi:hypothetical protein